ncbi:MAG: copper homeostasis protein CutC, partial [Terracidiphilus sp.]
AGDRIRIMAGGGIRASNVRTVALTTGVHEIHTSLRDGVEVKLSGRGAEFSTRQNGHKNFRLLEHDVRAFKSALDAIAEEAKSGSRRL